MLTILYIFITAVNVILCIVAVMTIIDLRKEQKDILEELEKVKNDKSDVELMLKDTIDDLVIEQNNSNILKCDYDVLVNELNNAHAANKLLVNRRNELLDELNTQKQSDTAQNEYIE